MKIILALCLINLVACEILPVSPSNRMIKKRMSTLRSRRIINGRNAFIFEYPWQASLGINGQHVCGAAVVSARVAVTAAHCYNRIYLRYGKYTLTVGSSFRDGHRGTQFLVTKFTLHPNYTSNPGEPRNDIAILTFNKDITGTSKRLAKAIAIPEDNDNNFTHEQCDITGWGRTDGFNTDRPDILQHARTRVISNAECRRRGPGILNSHVCVFTGFNGACNGDSGGPLTCRNVLVGICSFGEMNCQTRSPSVYTRISEYRAWIKSFIE